MHIKHDISERLDLLRYPLIIGVVFLHAYSSTVEFSSGEAGLSHTGPVVTFIRNLFSQTFARVAVPLFFLMSGYLFFRNYQPTINSYFGKLRSRFRSLLIPLILWNAVALLTFAALQSIPRLSDFLSGRIAPISSLSALDYGNALIGLTERYPISYQFWFIRDLIVLVLISLLFYFLSKRFALITLLVFTALWFAELSFFIRSILFFFLGAVICARGIDLDYFDKHGGIIFVSYICLAFIDAGTKYLPYNLILHKVGILFGMIRAYPQIKKTCTNEFICGQLDHSKQSHILEYPW